MIRAHSTLQRRVLRKATFAFCGRKSEKRKDWRVSATGDSCMAGQMVPHVGGVYSGEGSFEH